MTLMTTDRPLARFVIEGNPVTKKNSQRMVPVHGRVIPMPSKQFVDYEKHFMRSLPHDIPHGIHTPVLVRATYYMQKRLRVDMVNLLEATCDILVKAHVLVDDCRDIVASHDGSAVFYDKEHPRAEIEIIPLDGYQQWKEWSE